MPAQIDTAKAHLTRPHGDIVAVFTWVNDERAMVLAPALRPGAPWYVLMESAAYAWDDRDAANVGAVARRARKACEVLGIEPTSRNCLRVATIVIDGLPDLITMPPAPPKAYRDINLGEMVARANGDVIAAKEIKVERAVATYG